MCVQVMLPAEDDRWLQMSGNPHIDDLDIPSMIRAISSVPQPIVTGDAKFQLIFGLWGWREDEQ